MILVPLFISFALATENEATEPSFLVIKPAKPNPRCNWINKARREQLDHLIEVNTKLAPQNNFLNLDLWDQTYKSLDRGVDQVIFRELSQGIGLVETRIAEFAAGELQPDKCAFPYDLIQKFKKFQDQLLIEGLVSNIFQSRSKKNSSMSLEDALLEFLASDKERLFFDFSRDYERDEVMEFELDDVTQSLFGIMNQIMSKPERLSREMTWEKIFSDYHDPFLKKLEISMSHFFNLQTAQLGYHKISFRVMRVEKGLPLFRAN